MPTFFPSGFPSFPIPFRFELLSVKHIVNALCIDSAVPSTNDLRLSPWSTLATFRSRLVKSGLLSRVIASFARLKHICIVAGSMIMPYCGFDSAVIQALGELAIDERLWTGGRTSSAHLVGNVSLAGHQSSHPSNIPSTPL
jgi:hypothetical protein